MANYNQVPRVAVPGGDKIVKNYGATTLAKGVAVKYDTSNPGSTTAPIGVILTSSDAAPCGFLVDDIVAGGQGLMQRMGTACAVAADTIHVGVYLMTDSAGAVIPWTDGHYSVGPAASEAVSGDPVQVDIAFSINIDA